MNNSDIERLAEAIAEKLKSSEVENLWDAEKCATFLGVTQKHFTDVISKSFGFPPPVRLPSLSGRRGTCRWVGAEIQKWAIGQRAA